MSMVFMDSCGDGYGSDQVGLVYDTVSGTPPVVEPNGGRNDTNGLKLSAGTEFFAKDVPALDEYFVGIAFRLQAITTPVDIVEFNEGVTNHVTVTVLANGAIEVARDSSVLATSAAGTILEGAYNYMEVRVVVDDAAGIVTVDLDEFNIHMLTSQDTQNGGTGVINEIRLKGTSDVIFFDDFYVNNNSGASPQNGFLGNTHIEFNAALADGTINDFPILEPTTPTTHFDKVDEIPPDLDVSFVASSTPTDQELFTIPPLSSLTGDGTVFGVQVSVLTRKNNEGSRLIKTLIDPGVTIAEGPDLTLALTYDYAVGMFQQNPDTSSDWTEAEVEASEIGCEVT